MFKIGLKLWSINENYLNEAKRLFEEGYYNYIELYVVPNTFSEFQHLWANLNIPFIIHAPHFGSGLNLSKREYLESNKLLLKESLMFADRLKAESVIVHPGVNGSVEETIFQLNLLKDQRMLVENKPLRGNGPDLYCVGAVFDEIKRIIEETELGFCFDFGHAISTAAALKLNFRNLVNEFLSLRPKMFHLSDGKKDSIFDSHLHFGEGDFPLSDFLKLIPENALLTVETEKNSSQDLRDFEKDINYMRKLIVDKKAVF